MARKKVSPDAVQSVLLASRRRCALCWGINHDLGPKEIQIAHVDRNNSNSSPENLVALCLAHHDEYDTERRQTKSITEAELREHATRLQAILQKKEEQVLSRYLGDQVSRPQLLSTTADRLGEIVEAFEADSQRSTPNGLQLYQLFKSNAKIGDFVAAQECFRQLLHVFDKKSPSDGDIVPGYSYLGSRLAVPTASPSVSVVKALAYASTLDFGFFSGLCSLYDSIVLYGTTGGFKGIDARSIPHRSIDVSIRCYTALVRGHVVPVANWARSMLVHHIASLLRGYVASLALKATQFQPDIKIRVINQSGTRIRPTNDEVLIKHDPTLGDIETDLLPPDPYYRIVTDIACLPPKEFSAVIESLAMPPINLPSLLKDGTPEMSYEDLCGLLELWLTYRGAVMLGHFIVEASRRDELERHISSQSQKVVEALSAASKNILDERRLLTGQSVASTTDPAV